MKIAIGNDHAGTNYKFEICKQLEMKGHQVINFGTDTTTSVDYPDYAHLVADAVVNNQADIGILLCGSGNGVQMTANKHKKIRAALCWNNELVTLARKHNNANVLAIPARFVALEQAKEFVALFLTTDFEQGRHKNRTDKIPIY